MCLWQSTTGQWTHIFYPRRKGSHGSYKGQILRTSHKICSPFFWFWLLQAYMSACFMCTFSLCSFSLVCSHMANFCVLSAAGYWCTSLRIRRKWIGTFQRMSLGVLSFLSCQTNNQGNDQELAVHKFVYLGCVAICLLSFLKSLIKRLEFISVWYQSPWGTCLVWMLMIKNQSYKQKGQAAVRLG